MRRKNLLGYNIACFLQKIWTQSKWVLEDNLLKVAFGWTVDFRSGNLRRHTRWRRNEAWHFRGSEKACKYWWVSGPFYFINCRNFIKLSIEKPFLCAPHTYIGTEIFIYIYIYIYIYIFLIIKFFHWLTCNLFFKNRKQLRKMHYL
jgi:hypothetical protein